MQLAFCLYKYFPYGGLQRDFLRIARACQARGHDVRVFVLSWDGEPPADLDVTRLPDRGFTSPARYRHFSRALAAQLAQWPADAVVGFNKMPGLDIYYAADPCYAHKAHAQRSALYRLSPRYRHFARYEAAVFDAAAHTEILMIAPVQESLFRHHYGTPPERFHLLPPGIDPSRRAPPDAARVRAALRAEFSLGASRPLLLMVGSGFRTKGLDRALRGLAALPAELADVQLFVIGQDHPAPFQRLARRLGVAGRVRFFAGRDDIPRFLQGADLLVHPAHSENTGTVLLEALVAGLPVLTTANCGYAHYVAEAGAGAVLPEPYGQDAFDHALVALLTADRGALRARALAWAASADIHGLPERAAALIEQLAPGARRPA
ncbi:MAG: glycosyltransferase family 4 protein [Gammaproteobacteria bacterium]|nr:glycosyltransferase family 4 protein [Gammaproteobacteria bacterium]